MGIIAGILAAVIGGALFIFLPRTLVIEDVSRARSYRLSTSGYENAIHGLALSGRGDFQGTVKVELMAHVWNSEAKRSELKPVFEATLKDGGSFEWNQEWYSADADIRVTPGTARTGKITLRYHFETFL